jgi:large subunit ribosomal protein L25
VKGGAANRRLRREGLVPCVVYGHGKETLPFATDAHDLRMALRSGAHVYGLKIEGQEDDSVLVKEVQFDSLGDYLLHVDFMRIAMDEAIEVAVPIVTTGQAKGVINKGLLDLTLKALDLVGLPAAIPEEIRVAINDLDIGDSLTVADIVLPEGVTTTSDPDQTVVVVHPPPVEEEAVAVVEEEGAAEPEVIGGRKEEEGEEKEGEGEEEKKK